MGSIAVRTMVRGVSQAGKAQKKLLHPFFSAKKSAPSSEVPAANSADVIDGRGERASVVKVASEKMGKKGRLKGSTNRKRKSEGPSEEEKDQDEPMQPAKRHKAALAGGDIADHFIRAGAYSTCNGSVADKGRDGGLVAQNNHGPRQQRDGCPDPQPPMWDSSSSNQEVSTRPVKLVDVNRKTSTIGSPKKAKATEEASAPAKRRGRRPRHSKEAEEASLSKIVKLKCGGADAAAKVRAGARMAGLVGDESQKQAKPTLKDQDTDNSPRRATPAADMTASTKPAPAVHPLFLGKNKPLVPEKRKPARDAPKPTSAKHKIFTSTPCSPRNRRVSSPAAAAVLWSTRTAGPRFPGAQYPAWPWEGMVHVRGDEHGTRQDSADVSELPSGRKCKGRAVTLSANESLMDYVASSLAIPLIAEKAGQANPNATVALSRELRVPGKHFEGGSKLQRRIAADLRTMSTSAGRGTKTEKPGPRTQHETKASTDGADSAGRLPSSLAHLFGLVKSGLSAFDRSECETALWTQKYRPTCAVEVLQTGNEIFLLREWLEALMVQSVATGNTDPHKRKDVSAQAKTAGKRKKLGRLDGFVVSSDDEAADTEEGSDGEADWTSGRRDGAGLETVTRAGRPSGKRLGNAMLISGPHGCGKTAAVYAVAKEMDFEVFEINASARRSGRDIVEKIGDMTQNHLVRPQTSRTGQEAEETKRGKQSTMKAFFGPRQTKAKTASTTGTVGSKAAAGRQKQSLILLDEVDVLYEEDKQFWVTVMSLMAISKRPFVLTCNDETLVPVQSLGLHGILRLGPAPTALAVDRLLLVAANEGHALRRESVQALYESRNRDLRAATMDLNYWCQIGIGDRRGGFDWFYPRWPRGADLDGDREVVRVVSEETYRTGMNWLARGAAADAEQEQELFAHLWQDWRLDLEQWTSVLGQAAWAARVQTTTATRQGRIAALDAHGSFADTMSAADVCSCRSFAMDEQEAIDATHPPMPPKSRNDFVAALPLLDTPPVVAYESMAARLSCAMTSLGGQTLRCGASRPNDVLCSLIGMIRTRTSRQVPGAPVISRADFSLALDAIATSASPASRLVVLDVAPYVRSIVAHDECLQQRRRRLHSLVSEASRQTTNRTMRTTRAALSALDGGERNITRGSRWFRADLDALLVLRTGGEAWQHYLFERGGEGQLRSGPAQAAADDRQRLG